MTKILNLTPHPTTPDSPKDNDEKVVITLDELNKLITKAYIHGYCAGAPYIYKSLAEAKESANTP